MRISDWSSDVCSSDLTADAVLGINHIVADIEAQRLARPLVSFLRPMGLPLMRRGTQCGSADSATQSIVQTRRITRLCYRFITETAAEIYGCEAAGICIAPPGSRSVSRAAPRRSEQRRVGQEGVRPCRSG